MMKFNIEAAAEGYYLWMVYSRSSNNKSVVNMGTGVCANGDMVSFWGDRNVLELDRGESCITW